MQVVRWQPGGAGTNVALCCPGSKIPSPGPPGCPIRSPLKVKAHMTDKLRQRKGPAPHGFLPNWVLVAIVACAIAVVGLARTVV